MTGPTSAGSVDKNFVNEIYVGQGEAFAIDMQFEKQRSKPGKNLKMTIEFGDEEKEIGAPTSKVKMSDKEVREIAKIRLEVLSARKKEIEALLEKSKDSDTVTWLKTVLKATNITIEKINRDLSKVEDKDEIAR